MVTFNAKAIQDQSNFSSLVNTNTCCSHPWDNEEEKAGVLGVKRAAIRKLNHELGIGLDEFGIEDFHLHSRIHYKACSCDLWGENEIDYVLVRRTCASPMKFVPNLEEVAEARWIGRKQFIREFVQDPKGKDLLTPWVKLTLEHGLLWDIWDTVDEAKNDLDFEGKRNGILPSIQSFV